MTLLGQVKARSSTDGIWLSGMATWAGEGGGPACEEGWCRAEPPGEVSSRVGACPPQLRPKTHSLVAGTGLEPATFRI